MDNEGRYTALQKALIHLQEKIKDHPYREIGDEESYSEYRKGLVDGMLAAMEIMEDELAYESRTITEAFDDGYMTVVKTVGGVKYFQKHYNQPHKRSNQ